MTAGCSAVPPNVLLRSSLSISGSQHDLELIELIPLGVGPMPLWNRQQLLQASTGGSWLRFIHGRIISSFDIVNQQPEPGRTSTVVNDMTRPSFMVLLPQFQRQTLRARMRKEAPMKHPKFLAVVCMACAASGAPADQGPAPANPAIDMQAYLRVSAQAARHRETRQLTEAEFIRMSQAPGTVILDARSRQKYDELHVKGAINLSFPDIAIESLAQAIPDKNTPILIYCNNNFQNAEGPFPSKMPSASLNLSTYIALYNYGYRNVYELGPLVDIKDSRLAFVSSQ
jgi:hypothetical protein